MSDAKTQVSLNYIPAVLKHQPSHGGSVEYYVMDRSGTMRRMVIRMNALRKRFTRTADFKAHCNGVVCRLNAQLAGGWTPFGETQNTRLFTPIASVVELSDLCSRFEWLLDEQPCDIVNPTDVDGHLLAVKFGKWFYADATLYILARKRSEGRFGKDEIEDLKDALRTLGGKKDAVRIADEADFDMVLLWWNGVGNMLRELYPYVFADGDKPKSDYSPFKSLQNIHLMLNGGRPQDNEAIDQCDLHDVLSTLNAKIEEAERIRREVLKR